MPFDVKFKIRFKIKFISLELPQIILGRNSPIYDEYQNTEFSPHRFWPCHENRLIKTIQTTPHNLYVSSKLTSLYCGLMMYPGLS